MEIQLQELIDQIRQDGVAAAQAQADSIVEAAKKQAEAILSDAQARADGLAAQARAENERLVRASEEAHPPGRAQPAYFVPGKCVQRAGSPCEQ